MSKRLYTRFLTLLLSLSFILVTTISFAGTIGNPLPQVSDGQWMITGEFDNWDKDMDNNMDLESTRVMARFTYGISGEVDLFGRLGFSEFEIGSSDSDYEPAFGAGVKIKVHESGKMKVGVVGQFFRFSGDFSGADFDVTEIDIACGVNQKFSEALLGYAGLSISMVEVDFGRTDYDEDDPFFIFGGVEFKVNPTTDIGVEIRIFGGSSITLLANFDL